MLEGAPQLCLLTDNVNINIPWIENIFRTIRVIKNATVENIG